MPFAEAFIRGLTAGQQQRQQREMLELEKEDRALRKDLLRMQLQRMKFEERADALKQKRELAQLQAQTLSGTPAPPMTAAQAGVPALQEGQAGPSPEQIQVGGQHPLIRLPGVLNPETMQEEGGFEFRPPTQEDVLRQKQAEVAQQIQNAIAQARGTTQAEEEIKQPGRVALEKIQQRGALERAGVAARASADRRATLTPSQVIQETRSLSADFQRNTKAARTVLDNVAVAEKALMDIEKNPARRNVATQAVVTALNKILDPTSVVREGEYARTADGQAFIETLKGRLQSITAGGANITVETLKDASRLMNEFAARHQQFVASERERIGGIADEYGLKKELIFGKTDPAMGVSTPAVRPRATNPQTGEVMEFDGKAWVKVK